MEWGVLASIHKKFTQEKGKKNRTLLGDVFGGIQEVSMYDTVYRYLFLEYAHFIINTRQMLLIQNL